MKNTLFIALLAPLVVSFSARAINVGEVTVMMAPDAAILAKEIANPTDTAHYVSVDIQRLSSPMAGGTVIPMQSRSELLATPASLILPGHAKENLRFFYKGPQDDKERYYRLAWIDEPIAEHNASNSKKSGQATASAIIGTILVVAPRRARFDYTHQQGTVTNTRNISFRVISYGPCRDKTKDTGQGCRQRYYLMPGVSTRISHTDLRDKKTRIGIWHGQQYINVN